VFDQASKRISAELVQKSRELDSRQFQRMLVPHSAEESVQWQKLFRDVVEELARAHIDKTVVNRVLKARHLPAVR
jgi:hypothetical protein